MQSKALHAVAVVPVIGVLCLWFTRAAWFKSFAWQDAVGIAAFAAVTAAVILLGAALLYSRVHSSLWLAGTAVALSCAALLAARTVARFALSEGYDPVRKGFTSLLTLVIERNGTRFVLAVGAIPLLLAAITLAQRSPVSQRKPALLAAIAVALLGGVYGAVA